MLPAAVWRHPDNSMFASLAVAVPWVPPQQSAHRDGHILSLETSFLAVGNREKLFLTTVLREAMLKAILETNNGLSSLTKFLLGLYGPRSSKKLFKNEGLDAGDYVNVRIALYHLVREIQQDSVEGTADLAGLLVGLAESHSQN